MINSAEKAPENSVVLVGNPESPHAEAYFKMAGENLGISVIICDTREAFAKLKWINRWNWWVGGHRPTKLDSFSQKVVLVCKEISPKWVLSTGIAPLNDRALQEIGSFGIQRLNYLTDDPWNPSQRASWFMRALPYYDRIFSPRKSNLEDLRQLTGSQPDYLPFAYAPEVHYPDPVSSAEESSRYDCQVAFIGGADRDRLPWAVALIESGLKVSLYGGYWDRFSKTKAHARGMLEPEQLRKAISGAQVVLCLVRHANRDGHSMRTFEVPAMGGCMLMEDTLEHREFFGQDREAVAYFKTPLEMVQEAKELLSSPSERERLAKSARKIILEGRHTYQDRLRTILSF